MKRRSGPEEGREAGKQEPRGVQGQTENARTEERRGMDLKSSIDLARSNIVLIFAKELQDERATAPNKCYLKKIRDACPIPSKFGKVSWTASSLARLGGLRGRVGVWGVGVKYVSFSYNPLIL